MQWMPIQWWRSHSSRPSAIIRPASRSSPGIPATGRSALTVSSLISVSVEPADGGVLPVGSHRPARGCWLDARRWSCISSGEGHAAGAALRHERLGPLRSWRRVGPAGRPASAYYPQVETWFRAAIRGRLASPGALLGDSRDWWRLRPAGMIRRRARRSSMPIGLARTAFAGRPSEDAAAALAGRFRDLLNGPRERLPDRGSPAALPVPTHGKIAAYSRDAD